MSSSSTPSASLEHVAGNGLLHRRIFLTQAVALVSAGGLTVLSAGSAAVADPPDIPPWMRAPGAGMSGYGLPAKYEHQVQRTGIGSQPGTTGSGASRTPLERLDGMITPSGLHFERHHGGVPDIDPNAHRLLIHGLVKRPLVFTMDALLRYPMVSRIQFIECSGNSRPNLSPAAPAASCGAIHGLVSCSEWTGVPLAIVLAEAGADSSAQWLLAEGADAAAMSRSVPMAKAMDDALLAFYQNGERLRPENGYPVRLFLPGYEGNIDERRGLCSDGLPAPPERRHRRRRRDERADASPREVAQPRQLHPGLSAEIEVGRRPSNAAGTLIVSDTGTVQGRTGSRWNHCHGKGSSRFSRRGRLGRRQSAWRPRSAANCRHGMTAERARQRSSGHWSASLGPAGGSDHETEPASSLPPRDTSRVGADPRPCPRSWSDTPVAGRRRGPLTGDRRDLTPNSVTVSVTIQPTARRERRLNAGSLGDRSSPTPAFSSRCHDGA
jgi:Oxidoreductase molybdopterin binding domain